MIKAKLLIFIVLTGLMSIMSTFFLNENVSAVTPRDFNAGRIIDDGVFYNKYAMSGVSGIQDFLNTHVPACDTWGTQPSGYGNLTRAQYATQVMGWPGPPYSCLQNYHENPTTGETSFEKGGGAFAGGQSAAQIIWDAAQDYGINPQVLLVMLRKESAGPLTADSWPLKSQYKYAMGYGCPDSGPNYSANCESDKAGFYKQMRLAAWQLRYYADNIATYNYQPHRWNYIQYNPNPDCGGRDVYIENIATASLYIYTPYVPNDAALDAYPGEAYCGAYGNRNFFMMFNDWFGSTYGAINLISDLSISHDSMGRMYTGERTVSFTVKNNSPNVMDTGQIGVASLSPSGRTDGFVMKSAIIQPWQTYTYTDTQSHFDEEGDYKFWIVANNQGCSYCEDQPPSAVSTLVRKWSVFIQKAPLVTTALTVNQARPTKNANVDVSYTIRNDSARQVELGDMGVSLMHEDGTNVGMSMMPKVTIPANSERVITSSRILPKTGKYFASIVNTKDGSFWNPSFPLSSLVTNSRSATFTAKPSAALQVTPTLSSAIPRIGENITAMFKIQNFTPVAYSDGQIGLAVIDPNGRSVGFAMQDFTVPADGVLNYQVPTRNFDVTGIYRAKLVKNYNGVWSDFTITEDDTVKTNFTFEVKSNLTLQSAPVLSKVTPVVGEEVTATFNLKNYGSSSAKDYPVGLVVIDPNGKNVGFAMQDVVAPANGDYIYSVPARSFSVPGTYTAWIVQNRNGFWAPYDRVENSGVSSRFTFTVKSNLLLQSTPVFSESSIHANQSVSATFHLKNTAASEAKDYPVGLVVIDPNGKNVGFAMQDVVAPANGDYIYSVPARSFSVPGTYTAWIVQNRNGFWAPYDRVENSGVSSRFTFTVKPDATLVATPSLSVSSPAVGQLVNAQFTIKNHSLFQAKDYPVGLVVIDPNGKNVGFAMQEIDIPVGGTFTYSVPARSFNTPGTYNAWIVQNTNNYWSQYSKVENDTVNSKFQFTVVE